MTKLAGQRNCIILGCGRSGTSCLAGSISAAGYNIGGKGHAGNLGNPKGYFETSEVNGINDTMLFSDSRSVFTEGSRHGWLTRFPVNEYPKPLPDTGSRIKEVLKSQPFCIKDPRLAYTLPVWQVYIPDTAYICMIRHPGAVVNSMMENCRTAPYLSKIKINRSICYDIWRNMYHHLMRHAQPEWIFLHYNQILNGTGLDRVEDMLGVRVDKSFPDTSLCRSDSADDVPKDILKLYTSLRWQAGYH